VETDSETLTIDEAQLERLERDLADAADALESVERIRSAGLGGADSATAIRQLLDGGRFDVTPADEPSDLVGDGDVDAVEQVDAVAEVPLAPLEDDPAGAEVGHPLEGGVEPPLDLVDQAPVGDGEHVEIDVRAFLPEPADDPVEGGERPQFEV
jgi:hypothetical protein